MKKILLYSGIMLMLIAGCKKDDSSSSNVDSKLKSLAAPEQGKVFAEENMGNEEVTGDDAMFCKVQKVKVGQGFDENMLLDPQSDVIYPAAIIEGNSIVDGTYTPIVLPRGAMKISTSFSGMAGAKSAEVPEVSLSGVREAISNIFSSSVTGATAAQVSFEVKDVYSEAQLSIAVGASYGAVFGKIKASFDFSSTGKKHKYLVKFMQVYYTVDVDIPASPDKFFKEGVTSSQIDAVVKKGTSPVYVSSVKYGRIAYFCFESNEQKDSVKASLSASFGKADISASFSKSKYLKDIKITGTIIGGSGADAVKSISGLEGLKEYIDKGGNYSSDSPGAPIAYTLRLISNNSVFAVVQSSEYYKRDCRSTNINIAPKYFYSREALNGAWRLNGTVKATIGYDGGTLTGNSIYLFNSTIQLEKDKAKDYGTNDRAQLTFDYTQYDKAYIQIDVDLKLQANALGWKNVEGFSFKVNNTLTKSLKYYIKDIDKYKNRDTDGYMLESLYLDSKPDVQDPLRIAFSINN
jgi:hypothetical protein